MTVNKNNDFKFMQKAIDLALKGKGKTSPNPLVGAVIVKNDKIISEGYHRRCGADHAEVVALKRAGQKAQNAKLYVNLEPCHHFGRTPPCVDAIIKGKIKEVVIGMKDPNPRTNGKSIRKLQNKGIRTRMGILNEECQRTNEVFTKYIKKKMPFVVAKTAQTLDGKIATAKGESKWITSQQARNFSRRLRNEFDAILVGVNTVIHDNPRLTASRKAKNLKKIVLDSNLKISPKAQLFKNTNPSDIFLATTKKASKKKIKAFQKKGIHVLIDPKSKSQIRLKWLFKEFAKHGITSILIEGGAQVIGSALKERLIDKMYVYIAPKIIGDHKALSSINGVQASTLSNAVRLQDLNVQKIGNDISLNGYVFRNR